MENKGNWVISFIAMYLKAILKSMGAGGTSGTEDQSFLKYENLRKDFNHPEHLLLPQTIAWHIDVCIFYTLPETDWEIRWCRICCRKHTFLFEYQDKLFPPPPSPTLLRTYYTPKAVDTRNLCMFFFFFSLFPLIFYRCCNQCCPPPVNKESRRARDFCHLHNSWIHKAI